MALIVAVATMDTCLQAMKRQENRQPLIQFHFAFPLKIWTCPVKPEHHFGSDLVGWWVGSIMNDSGVQPLLGSGSPLPPLPHSLPPLSSPLLPAAHLRSVHGH